MSDYYNPNRGPAWNYGGDQWRLSRSKIDLFLECAHCFYIDNRLGGQAPVEVAVADFTMDRPDSLE